MMFTVPMKHLNAAVLQKDVPAVTEELLRLGSLDAVSVGGLEGSRTTPGARVGGQDIQRLSSARKRIEGLMRLANPPLPRGDPATYLGEDPPLIAEVEKRLDAFAARLQSIRQRQAEVQERMLKVLDLKRQVEAQGDQKRHDHLSGSSLVAMKSGSVPEAGMKSLESAFSSLPALILKDAGSSQGRISILVVSLKRDEERIKELLDRFGWKAEEKGALRSQAYADSIKEIEERKAGLEKILENFQNEYAAAVSEKASDLARDWGRLRVAELSQKLNSGFRSTESVCLISGWIPREETADVEAGIKKASQGRCYVEWAEPEDSAPPVQMKNPSILAPFQALVTNYGIPGYGAVDPTPFVAVAYLCMFGLMFGDAGHGAVLAVLGFAGMTRAKRRGTSDTLVRLIFYCGLAAVAAGFLFGSFFGFKLFPALWFDYHRAVLGQTTGGAQKIGSIYDILGITIKFGIGVLGTGFLINWVNLFRRKEWRALALDKAGLAGGWIYAAGTYVAFYFVDHEYRSLPNLGTLALILGIPTLLLGLNAPLARAMRREKEKQGVLGLAMEFLMEWVVEILEVYSGYLANTLSFMRVAGLGIAHVSLMSAFFQIARSIHPQGGFSVAGILVLIMGNILVIGLEGLSAGIQSLRLNYYEFFSKYFDSTGRAYAPVSLRNID
jgi:V/A-type H+-transporting ATPase subunit I